MEKDLLKKFEGLLLEEKRKLEEELGQLGKQNAHNPEHFDAEFPQLGDKEDENASEVAEFSKNLTLERTLESSLKDVRKALDRINDGSYGTCKYCGKPIGDSRLEAMPATRFCVDDQMVAEGQAPRPAG